MFRNHSVRTWGERWQRYRLTIDAVLNIVEDESISISQDSYVSKLRLHHLPLTHPDLMVGRAEYLADFAEFRLETARIAAALNMPLPEIPHLRKSRDYNHQDCFSKAEMKRFKNVYQAALEFYQNFLHARSKQTEERQEIITTVDHRSAA
jgi:hypothetical protein